MAVKKFTGNHDKRKSYMKTNYQATLGSEYGKEKEIKNKTQVNNKPRKIIWLERRDSCRTDVVAKTNILVVTTGGAAR